MQRVVRVGGLCAAVAFGWAATVFAQGSVTRVSVAPGGAQASGSNPSMSADGQLVAYDSLAANLVPGDTNNSADIFVHNRATGTTERVSLGALGVQGVGGGSVAPSMSADGRFVAFSSGAVNLTSLDTNGVSDVFVRDRLTAATTRVSVSTAGAQVVAPANGGSSRALISADGRFVAFTSNGTNLVDGDTNDTYDAFLHDRVTLTTVRLSVATGGAQANGPSTPSAISADGRYVVFESTATNLVPGDTNNQTDVFVRDVQAGVTTRVSVWTGGAQGGGRSEQGTISADGRLVAFASTAGFGGDGSHVEIFVHDRQTGVTSSLDLTPTPVTVQDIELGPFAQFPVITGDGRFICYNMTRFEEQHRRSIVVLDRLTGNKRIVTGPGKILTGLFDCALSADGSVVAFSSDEPDVVAGDTNNTLDVFVRTLETSSLGFGAINNGQMLVSQTAPQNVLLTVSAAARWTAASDRPWLQVSPVSGSGPAMLSISIKKDAPLPLNGTLTGTITLFHTGTTEAYAVITVNLTLTPPGSSTSPFGNVDTPTDNRNGVTGAVPFTGWALDDVEVTRVSICRAAFGAEVAPVDPNCGGAAEVFVGFATFVEGARPDVAGGYASYPHASRAGWGFMLLTNMLPAQGNGTYRFTMRAQDREGSWFVLGTRTMACANASAIFPFGTIDTPLQGGTASGSNYVNFGWALTPQPKTIPIDGSTIQVFVDGVNVGNADYNHARSDIQAAFPGYNNTNGAVGFRVLDTTAMPNGLHTISWVVADDRGATEGVGSRFFTVSNGVAAVTAASTRAEAGLDSTTLDTSPLAGRRGWNLEAPYGLFGTNANGVTVIRSEEVSRIELQLGEGSHRGHLRAAGGLAPLPIGARLDVATNTFTWAPGVGFVGPYDFVFVRSVNGRAASRREVRIVLQPKARGAVGPQVVIDIPASKSAVREPFAIGGWAVDLDAIDGTGVTTLHAWAYPASGGAPIFLGATEYGGARPDIAAVHGERFKPSGFGLIVQGLPAGDYDLALFAWSTETMGFVAPKILRVTVTP